LPDIRLSRIAYGCYWDADEKERDTMIAAAGKHFGSQFEDCTREIRHRQGPPDDDCDAFDLAALREWETGKRSLHRLSLSRCYW
jgi:hypothetical protein